MLSIFRRQMTEKLNCSSLNLSASLSTNLRQALGNPCQDVAQYTAAPMSSSMLVFVSRSATTAFLFANKYDTRTTSKILDVVYMFMFSTIFAREISRLLRNHINH